MTRILKTSGFLGLTIQMVWGMYNTYLITPGGPDLPSWLVGAHAHFGVLGILAIVLGFAVDRYEVEGTQRRIVTYAFVLGQWLLPATIVVAAGTGMMMLTMLDYLWGILLFVAMAIMAWNVWNEGA